MGKINKKENGNLGKKVGGKTGVKNFNNKPEKSFPKQEGGKIAKQKKKVKKNIDLATIPKDVKSDLVKNKKPFQKKPNPGKQNSPAQNGAQSNKKQKPGKKNSPEKSPIAHVKNLPQKQKKENVEKGSPQKQNGSPKQKQNKKSQPTETPKNVKPKKEKKVLTPEQKEAKRKLLENAPPFTEKAFYKVLTSEKIVKVFDALKKTVKEASKNVKNVFDDHTYLLTVSAWKVPKCPKRMVKLKLKYALTTDEDDVCLIVRDIKRGLNVDYEPTIEQTEELLREKGVTSIKTVIPVNKLKKEYNTHEMKRKLSQMYDAYLCDGAVIGEVVGFLGKRFMKTRCAPIPIRMDVKNLSKEIDTALRKTSYKQGVKGNLISIVIGNKRMSSEQMTENVLAILEQLKEVYPGSLENIRNMYLRTNIVHVNALPLFVSTCRPPAQTPVIIGPKEEKLNKIKKDAEEVLKNFKLSADGKVAKNVPGQKRSIEADASANKKAKNAKKQKLAPEVSDDEDEEEEEVAVNTKSKKEKVVPVKEVGKKSKNAQPEPESEDDDSEDEDDDEDEGTPFDFAAGSDDDDDEDDDDDDDDEDDDDDDDDEDDDEEDDDDDSDAS